MLDKMPAIYSRSKQDWDGFNLSWRQILLPERSRQSCNPRLPSAIVGELPLKRWVRLPLPQKRQKILKSLNDASVLQGWPYNFLWGWISKGTGPVMGIVLSDAMGRSSHNRRSSSEDSGSREFCIRRAALLSGSQFWMNVSP